MSISTLIWSYYGYFDKFRKLQIKVLIILYKNQRLTNVFLVESLKSSCFHSKTFHHELFEKFGKSNGAKPSPPIKEKVNSSQKKPSLFNMYSISTRAPCILRLKVDVAYWLEYHTFTNTNSVRCSLYSTVAEITEYTPST